MPSLKAIRKRIASTKNTQKITKAMKMVAAAKLRRAQEAAQALRPYARSLGQITHDVAEKLLNDPFSEAVAEYPAPGLDPAATHPSDSDEANGASSNSFADPQFVRRLLVGHSEKRVRVVLVSADRGLAGAYNSSLFRRFERYVVEEADKQVDLLVLGKKGREYFRRRPFKVVHELAGVEPKTVIERAGEVATLLGEALRSSQVDAVYVLYNEFKSVSSQNVKLERLLPLRLSGERFRPVSPQREEAHPSTQKAKVALGERRDGLLLDDEPRSLLDFEYEPSRDQVLTQLVPLYLDAELQRILLEAIASEFGARMRAMDSASRNAKEMISRLTLQYNRARQAAITKELMEIIGGAEALKG